MDRRAVSTTLSYTLTLTIATLLVTGLVIAGSDFVNDRREQVIREELEVIGQQVAADLAQGDRLVRAADSSSPTVNLIRNYPERVARTGYQLTLDTTNDEIVLKSVDPEITVTVGMKTSTSITTDTSVNGGKANIVYTGSQLEVQND